MNPLLVAVGVELLNRVLVPVLVERFWPKDDVADLLEVEALTIELEETRLLLEEVIAQRDDLLRRLEGRVDVNAGAHPLVW